MVWTVLVYIFSKIGLHPLRLVVLFGTFALAMAFAGNDLVNFIGVPIAGLESFLAWQSSDAEAMAFSMEILKEPVRTNSLLLIGAGVIMIVTLWFSKKARSVTETEVNLGRQDDGFERFNPNWLARRLVGLSNSLSKVCVSIVPTSWLNKANKSFEKPGTSDEQRPAFDLVRASVNLTMASTLIAFATSQKLPLSTTYVSFMVAMGTSLADRAWGQDSAVYRVAGVLNVVAGWLATALIAFLVSGLFVLVIYHFELSGLLVLIAGAAYFIYRSFRYHGAKEKKKEARLKFENTHSVIDGESLVEETTDRIIHTLSLLSSTCRRVYFGIIQNDLKEVVEAQTWVRSLEESNEELQYELHRSISRTADNNNKATRLFIYVFDLEQDLVQSAKLIVDACHDHLANHLSPLRPHQQLLMTEIQKMTEDYLRSVENVMRQSHSSAYDITRQKRELLDRIDLAISEQILGIKGQAYGPRNSQLMFRVLLETKDIIAVAARYVKLYSRMELDTENRAFILSQHGTHEKNL